MSRLEFEEWRYSPDANRFKWSYVPYSDASGSHVYILPKDADAVIGASNVTAKGLSDITRQLGASQGGLIGGLGAYGLGQLGLDISHQLGSLHDSLDRQHQQISAPISDAQRSRLYDAAMSRDSIRQACGPTFDYHYCRDTHISEWSKTPPSPEIRLDEKFPCLAQARRKRVRMKKLIITAILSILGTGSLAMYGPKFVAWYNAPPTSYVVYFDCPNCGENAQDAYVPWGTVTIGYTFICDNCGHSVTTTAGTTTRKDTIHTGSIWEKSVDVFVPGAK